ncbi:ATP-dependent zinc metalloprotease FtsH [Candidatus Phytoplasma pruni]|uniref:ATP-dependent zinc metalloprotease FtsH n=2 Tax=Candidatus Phytoplasma pruni TaxID=479893 RepID=A0A851HHM8_9MOLU|nr:ATP-dependent zinc metalloprotease FtsH [Candidatus Phytoplasma pruni]
MANLLQRKNKNFLLLLIIIFFLLTFFIYEFYKEWYNKGTKIDPYDMLHNIENKTFDEINIYEVGESVLRKNNHKKIEGKDFQNNFFYTEMDGVMYLKLLEYIESAKKQTSHSDVNIKINYKPKLNIFSVIIDIMSGLSTLLFSIYIYFSLKTARGEMGNKNKTSSEKSSFTFQDVAGNEEEKEELTELIDFLKNPKKYNAIGASIPKGFLLEGPPGTGKTLLAKAVSGEAGVPFYAVSGSEFVEMYVGVGASRVRKLFKDAKANAPCIVFIDEIDVLGGKRNSGNSGGSQEKDQTLNQLLTEMDGFSKTSGVIVMAATNRADILDPALLRPGRFDRRFTVGLPDLKAREAILKVHAKNKKIAPEVDFKKIAKSTPGMSGAQLGAVLNEASILTVRNQKETIHMLELEEAIDRVLMGPAKKSRKYDEEERKMVAYHEAGHAVIGLKLEHAQKVQKITIIPRGDAGGYNLMMPEKETFFSSKKRMLAQITSYLGGRVAEELIFEDVSSGAYDDFKQATKIARLMVTKYGMSALGPTQDQEFSDKKAINQKITKIIDSCYIQAQKLIQDNKDLLDKIVFSLLENETIHKDELELLVA